MFRFILTKSRMYQVLINFKGKTSVERVLLFLFLILLHTCPTLEVSHEQDEDVVQAQKQVLAQPLILFYFFNGNFAIKRLSNTKEIY